MRRLRRRVRIGAPDRSLTAVSGMAAVAELVDRLAMIRLLDKVIGPIKTRDRGHTAGELLAGMACAQLAGEQFLVGLDRQCADSAGQVLAAVPGLASTTAAGLARRLSAGRWQAVETGLGDVAERALAMLPTARAAALCRSVTIDLDTTDVEVYGRHKPGVASTPTSPTASWWTSRSSVSGSGEPSGSSGARVRGRPGPRPTSLAGSLRRRART